MWFWFKRWIQMRGKHSLIWSEDYHVNKYKEMYRKLWTENRNNPNIKKIQTQVHMWQIMTDKWLITTQIFDAPTPRVCLPQETVVILIIFCSSASKGATRNHPREQKEWLKHTFIDGVSKTSNNTVRLYGANTTKPGVCVIGPETRKDMALFKV